MGLGLLLGLIIVAICGGQPALVAIVIAAILTCVLTVIAIPFCFLWLRFQIWRDQRKN